MALHERAALYRFLARAYLKPPDEDFLELAGEIPSLAPFLDDVLVTRHSWLIDLNVYPYASIFLDPSGMLNAPWSGFVAGVYRALGLEVAPSATLAAGDHVSAQLEALSVLLEREVDANDALNVERARHGQRTLLFEHALPWVPVFTRAIQRIDRGFYGIIAELTREVLFEHAEELTGIAPLFIFPVGEDSPVPLPSVSKKRHGEARIAFQNLITPACSGMFLSREDIARLGKDLGLPVRFAERAFMLTALAELAADHDQFSELFVGLGKVAQEQEEVMRSWTRGQPALHPIFKNWLRKLKATRKRLAELAQSTEA